MVSEKGIDMPKLYEAVTQVTKDIPYSRQLFCEGEITEGHHRWEIAFEGVDGLPVIEWVWAKNASDAVTHFLSLHGSLFFTVRLTSDNE
jgi:hypothetical protein